MPRQKEPPQSLRREAHRRSYLSRDGEANIGDRIAEIRQAEEVVREAAVARSSTERSNPNPAVQIPPEGPDPPELQEPIYVVCTPPESPPPKNPSLLPSILAPAFANSTATHLSVALALFFRFKIHPQYSVDWILRWVYIYGIEDGFLPVPGNWELSVLVWGVELLVTYAVAWGSVWVLRWAWRVVWEWEEEGDGEENGGGDGDDWGDDKEEGDGDGVGELEGEITPWDIVRVVLVVPLMFLWDFSWSAWNWLRSEEDMEWEEDVEIVEITEIAEDLEREEDTATEEDPALYPTLPPPRPSKGSKPSDADVLRDGLEYMDSDNLDRVVASGIRMRLIESLLDDEEKEREVHGRLISLSSMRARLASFRARLEELQKQ